MNVFSYIVRIAILAHTFLKLVFEKADYFFFLSFFFHRRRLFVVYSCLIVYKYFATIYFSSAYNF